MALNRLSTILIKTKFSEDQKKTPPLDEIQYSEITIDKILGGGAVSTVYLGHYKKEQVVIKCYSYDKIDPSLYPIMDEHFFQELNTLKAIFPSKYVVNPVGYCQKTLMTPAILLMEYAEHGSLEDYLCENTSTFIQAMDIVNDVALGLLRLLEVNMVHRDIKTANILLTKDFRAKICDFDLARSKDIRVDEEIKLAGSSFNLAPEYYLSAEFKLKKDGLSAADVFSFGVVLMDIFFNKNNILFYRYQGLYAEGYRLDRKSEPKDKVSLLHQMIGSADFPIVPECYREEIKHIIESCIGENPANRASMESVQHRLQDIVNRLHPQPSAPVVDQQTALSVYSRINAGTAYSLATTFFMATRGTRLVFANNRPRQAVLRAQGHTCVLL